MSTKSREKTITLGMIKKNEICPGQLKDKKVTDKTDEYWNSVSLMFLATFGMIKASVNQDYFSRHLDTETKRFGANAVIFVNESLQKIDPVSFISIANKPKSQVDVKIRDTAQGEIFSTSLDLMGEREMYGVKQNVAVKFKFSPAVSDLKDVETLGIAIATAYKMAGKEEFGTLGYEDLPKETVVYRISLLNRSTSITSFSRDEIIAGEDIIRTTLEKTRNTLNTEEETLLPGDHCLKCHRLQDCPMSELKAENIEDEYKKVLYHKAVAKDAEAKVKAYALELANTNLETVADNGEITLALGEKAFGSVKISRSEVVVKSRKKAAPTAQDVLRVLIDNEYVTGEEGDLDGVSVKISPKMMDILLKEEPTWTEYFKISHRVTQTLQTPKDDLKTKLKTEKSDAEAVAEENEEEIRKENNKKRAKKASEKKKK